MSLVRLARLPDAPAIALLSRQAIEHGLPWKWTARRVSAAIVHPSTNVVVAEAAGRVAGFGIMSYQDEHAHLVLFAVAEGSRRGGVGSELLAWLETVARVAGLARIRVEARADNEAALAFYRRHGYIEREAVLGMYYGAEDGVRLEKSIVDPPSDAVAPKR